MPVHCAKCGVSHLSTQPCQKAASTVAHAAEQPKLTATMKLGVELCDKHEGKFQVEWAEDRPSGRVKVNMCIACNYEALTSPVAPPPQKETTCGTAENVPTSTNEATRLTVKAASPSGELLSSPQRIAKKKSDFNSPEEWLKYLDSLLNAPEANVKVNPDGSCSPVAPGEQPPCDHKKKAYYFDPKGNQICICGFKMFGPRRIIEKEPPAQERASETMLERFLRLFGSDITSTQEDISFIEEASEVYNYGFETAHSLRKCGHSAGDFRDPGYIPGRPNTYTASESCIGCETVATAAKLAREEALEEAVKACENERRCYADSHRCHDDHCHDQDIAAIRALAAQPSTQPKENGK